jgi:catechol 2,3-dioxygenase-like lactoylglutathione lyase family enzyme
VPAAPGKREAAEEVMNNPADTNLRRPRLVGMNHIALEVGDVEQALAFYGKIFEFTLRGRGKGQAFIDMGDQFIALTETRAQHRDVHRHFGLVVDDRSAVRELAKVAGAELLEGGFLDFLDPWGNRVQVVEYADLQFTKAPEVLRAMGLNIQKSEKALKELTDKGIRA